MASTLRAKGTTQDLFQLGDEGPQIKKTSIDKMEIVKDDGTTPAQLGVGAPLVGADAENKTSVDARLITTTEGIQGGGDLSANRTHKLDISGLTEDVTPDVINDFLAAYDASAGLHKKVSITNLVATLIGIVKNNFVEATSVATRTLTSFAVINLMTLTPGAGTYIVLFSTSGSVSKNSRFGIFSIFANGVQVTASERQIGGQANNEGGVTCYAKVTVADGQAIDVRWRLNSAASSPTITITSRSLILLKAVA